MKKLLMGALSVAVVLSATAEGAEVEGLIKKLKSTDSDERRAAATALAELGAEAKGAVPALTAALKDKDLFVRRYAAQALGAIGADARKSVPGLRALLSDSRKEVREAAVVALGKVGGPEAVQALAAAVRDGANEPSVRKKAAEALGALGPGARSAVPALTAALTGKAKKAKKTSADDDVRVEVAAALGAIAKPQDKAAVAALKAVSEGKQRNKALKKTATDALRKIDKRKD
jgi:HEAT repeat protein